MRLFIAINFQEEVKNKVQDVISEVKKHSSQGRFVSNEHIHLTLEFLGETPPGKVEVIKEIMNKTMEGVFSLKLSKLGYFKRREGNVCWVGIEYNESLINLQAKLHKLLKDEGFKLEDRPYKPHITIGRKVKLKEGFNYEGLGDIIEGTSIEVEKIDLMESKHENGKLIYTIIHSTKDKN